ncbi:unnamed protein product [Heligmosomoides polygyrus]|uniref:Helicase ATP-binding domain-containing protein n=1 Tax=Heligmosomoides polygyrus TaxID=6339 RepID=A0A3P8EIR7_HELPZ|nr:unnamed protein product [Heligmosomoides polygyrus]
MVFEDRLTEPSGSIDPQDALTVFNNPYASLNMKQQRARLPIYKNRDHILYLCEKYRTVVIVGETGCGKSTQVPQYLMEAGWTNDGRMIAVTQPRRVAVVTLAARVAEEKDTILGQDVGYTVRFDDVTDDQTKIKLFRDFFELNESDDHSQDTSVIMSVEGRTHPVTIYHTKTSVNFQFRDLDEWFLLLQQ